MKLRTKLLVMKPFQRWFIVSFLSYTAIFLSILGASLYLFFRLMVDEMLQVGGLLSQSYAQTLQQNLDRSLYVIAGITVGLLIIAGAHAFFFSYKIAGPLFAITRHIEKCADAGQLVPLALRKDDLFSDLAVQISRLAKKQKQ